MDEESNLENVDSTNDTEETVETTEEVADTTSEDVEKLKDLNRKLFVRAKTAEGFVLKDGHWVKKAQEVKKEVQLSPSFVTKDEHEEGLLRISKGYNDEDLAVLKVVSKGKGISVLQAEQDPMFALHLEKKAAEAQRAKAQLGASKGSGSTSTREKPKTRDEHLEMWKEKMGQ